MSAGTLYVVATPIGNLEDLSPRAASVLASVDVVAAEDTRHTGRLLSHAGVRTTLVSLHEHNEDEATVSLVTALREGSNVALVSDAGTPLISDPGFRLVRAAHGAGIAVSPVPGPSAAIAALSVAGLPTDRFVFEGFLPPRKRARRERLAALATEPRTLVFYESVHRVSDTLADLQAAFGDDRPAFIGRELTKLHEECVAATLGELGRRLAAGAMAARGEFVLVVGGSDAAPAATAVDTDRLLTELAVVLPKRQAAAIAARVSGRGRNALYRRLLELGDDAE